MKPQREFITVQIVVTAKEYEGLRRQAALLGSGTVSEAIRDRLGWYPTPYGYLRYLEEQRKTSRPGRRLQASSG